MGKKQRISVVDADARRSQSIASVISGHGDLEVIMSSPNDSSDTAFAQFDAIVVGASKRGDGVDTVLRRIESSAPDVPVVVVGVRGCFERRTSSPATRLVESAGESPEPEQVANLVRGLLRKSSTQSTATQRRPSHLFRSLVGDSREIRQVQDLVEHVAATQSTVLITGESGTGKEVVARNIHYRSARRDRPFVPINCAAIPADLFESELFGHEKGAFTGALSTRKGRFELANTGTLFLDEIGDMPPGTQTKLLRVIQERVFERLGSNESIATDVRIIAATHCDLERRIRDKRFRKDLYYRLNVFPIDMPSLRHRACDIPLLIAELCARLASELGLEVAFADDALACLQQREWDGNVRELANAIERLAVLYPGETIDAQKLPTDLADRGDVNLRMIKDGNLNDLQTDYAQVSIPSGGVDLKRQLCQMERDLIEQALVCSGGVIAKAARLLKIGRTTLTEKVRRYDIQIDQTDTSTAIGESTNDPKE